MTEELIKAKIISAEQGREIWLTIKKKCELTENTFVILFPHSGTMCNTYIIQYLQDFMNRTGAEKVVLLSYDENILNAKIENTMSCFISREDAEKIMDYYTLQTFTDKLIIASLDEPEGRNGSNIIGINGITEKEVAAVGILGLSEWADAPRNSLSS